MYRSAPCAHLRESPHECNSNPQGVDLLSRSAIVCGAGIGGLCTALALHARGWSVRVIEQAQELREVGAGLQLSPNACRVLAALDLLPALQATAYAPQALEMRLGHSGQQIFRIPLDRRSAARWGGPYLHMHRADLLAVLAKALQQRAPGALQLGAQLSQINHTPHGVEVELADGRQLDGQLLVGADGIHSRVRELLFGPDQAHFTGHVAWRAVVPIDALGAHAPPPSACVWTGRGRHAVTYRLRAGTLANLVGVVEHRQWSRESWTQAGDPAEALNDFAGWHPQVTSLIKHAQQPLRWALFDRPPLARWHHHHCVLLGDASHPMLPFLAQGAAMAIEDAWVLASCLQTDEALPLALARFQRLRHSRTTQVQQTSKRNARLFHRAAPAYWPLWLVARLWPEFIHSRQDWLYRYDVTAPTTLKHP